MTLNETELSPGERLLVSRRRADLTQDETAAVFGVSAHVYKQWELDKRSGGDAWVGELASREWCFLLRRREGLTLALAAQLSGLPARWIHRAERGEVADDSPLCEWWKKRGAA